MAFNFPDSPVEGQQYAAPGGPVYQYTSGTWTLMGGSAAPTPLSSFRNRIINGDFAIDQRNNGAGVGASASTVFGPDRWQASAGGGTTGMILIRRDPYSSSEYMCLLYSNIADASLAAGDYYTAGQAIEGFNCRDFLWGQADAKPITISFWTYASAVVTLPIAVRNNTANRSWIGSFTIPVANTWTRIVMTVPGDVTGTWEKGNLTGMNVLIGLGVGSTYTGVAGWQGGNILSMPGMTNFMGTISQSFYLRDFQVELGTVATEFERVQYGDQLARCQRYYEASAGTVGTLFSGNTTTANTYYAPVDFSVTKRATPTVVLTHVSAAAFPATAGSSTLSTTRIQENRASNLTGSGGYFVSSWTANAEL